MTENFILEMPSKTDPNLLEIVTTKMTWKFLTQIAWKMTQKLFDFIFGDALEKMTQITWECDNQNDSEIWILAQGNIKIQHPTWQPKDILHQSVLDDGTGNTAQLRRGSV